jgi:hypothetical protein
LSPDRRVVSVAAADAPVGRPLAPHELVDVAVNLAATRETPEDPVERRRWLLNRLVEQVIAAGGLPTVADLARVLTDSEATIRRDLRTLRIQGREVPTRGRRTG